jgi:hypothetical protein
MKRSLLFLTFAAMLGCTSTLPPEAQHYRTACDQGDKMACLDRDNLSHNQDRANTQEWYYQQYGTVPSMSPLGPDNVAP